MVEPGFDQDDDDDDEDDIARFERQCAERARAEGLVTADDPDEDVSDEEPPLRLGSAGGYGPKGVEGTTTLEADGELARKNALLQERLARREAELSQVRSDLDMLRSEGLGPGDQAGADLKQRLLDLTKKNRRLAVTGESQKTRIQQLEAELRRPRDEMKRQAEEMAAQANSAMLGDGMEDWKQKYLGASNKLQEVRLEVQELRVQVQRQKRVLLKELGSEETIASAMAVADDPNATQWKGRAAQVAQLQRQLKELREQSRRPGDDGPDPAGGGADTPQKPRRRSEQVTEKGREGIAQAAEKRREEFERLQEEAEKLRAEQAEARRKRDALKSRNSVLEGQLRELKAHVQTLLKKSENDDELVAAVRRQLGRGAIDDVGGRGSDTDALRRENAELQAQLERQALIVQQLRQKTIAASCENGSARLGPRSVESAAGERALIERVRYLEADNARQSEQLRLLREQSEGGHSRPYSSASSIPRDPLGVSRRCSEDDLRPGSGSPGSFSGG